jgi:hypothetical protein
MELRLQTKEETFENKMEYYAEHLLEDLDKLAAEIAQKGNFQLWLEHHLNNIDLNNTEQFKWFEDNMNRLIEWDRKLSADIEKAVEDLYTITDMLKQLSKFYKYWPFSVTVNSDMQILSANWFKSDLESTKRFFSDQLNTDEHVLEHAKNDHHTRARFWYKTSVMHHHMGYGFTPHAIHLIIPRHEFRIGILRSIAEKRVNQLKKILAKEGKYYEAQQAYHAVKYPVTA